MKQCRSRLENLGVRLPARTVGFGLLPEVRHAFTHLKAVYRPMLVAGAEGVTAEMPTPEEHKWVLPDQLEDLPLPVAQRKILELARSAMTASAPTR